MSVKSISKWTVLWTLVSVIALYAILFALTGFNDNPLKQKLMELPWVIQLHALGGAVALLIGLAQLNIMRRHSPEKVHKLVGRVYGLAVLVSGVAGLVMAVRADGGLVAQLGFALLAVMWIATILRAVFAIRQGNVEMHKRLILLNYSLTWAAVTLRVEMPILAALFGFEMGYVLVAWLCWLPNLAVMSLWLQRRQASQAVASLN